MTETRQLIQIAAAAKKARKLLSILPSAVKAKALKSMAAAINREQKKILIENKKDLVEAKKLGLSGALLSRLTLDEKNIKGMANSIREIASMKDPVGEVIEKFTRPNGLKIKKVRIPIGTILIIYESRPNVTADCIALCLKSGNSLILKGGKEAYCSNTAIFNVLQKAALKAGVPKGAFSYVLSKERSATNRLLTMADDIDLVIPRGGTGLIRAVSEISKIPVIKHLHGICHVYVDKKADTKKALAIALNAKAQNPGVCNAMETLLVHETIASRFLPSVGNLLRNAGVEIRGCQKTCRLLSYAKKAKDLDWRTEYLDLILSIKVVKNTEEAIQHIHDYGSHHSDAIVTQDKKAAEQFEGLIDSSCVLVNASTRFNDGGQFGMGAEMGISTDKLHARGPVGLRELTTYKYVVEGQGQVRT